MGRNGVFDPMGRRGFLTTAGNVSAGLMISSSRPGETRSKITNEIQVGLIGAGAQGQALVDAALLIPDIRFRAVCDIWEGYNLKRITRILSKFKHENKPYTDYRAMLAAEKDKLDAVIVATPDFWHAEQAIECMKAGLHVYCEKEMSTNLDDARRMVLTSRETGKLLQIGHQRRSNPRYIFALEKLVQEARLFGNITNIFGQWNRAKRDFLAMPEKYHIPQAVLNQYGFRSMVQFLNWRWYKGLGGGAIVDLGSHQIDIFNWYLGIPPKSVVASGGTDYYSKATHEWYDTVLAIYEYQTKRGVVRAFYQTLTTNGFGGYYEAFMGDEGTLEISESIGRGVIYRDVANAPDWAQWVKRGYILAPKEEPKPAEGTAAATLDVRETLPPPSYSLPVQMKKRYHQPHLENFFDAIRGKAKLNCPGEVGFETAVTVLKVNDAVDKAQKLEFAPHEFEV